MEHLLQGLIDAKSSSELFLNSLNLLYKKYRPNHCFLADTSCGDALAYTKCYLQNGKLAENFSYSLQGTPCDIALSSDDGHCFYPNGIQKVFPDDQALIDLEAHAYIGVPLTARNGERVGLIVMLFDKDMPDLVLDDEWLNHLGFLVGQELYQRKLNKKNEQLIRQFSHVEAITNIGFFSWDFGSQSFEFSPNFWSVVGTDPQPISNLPELFSRFIFKLEHEHLDFATKVLANLSNPNATFVSKNKSPINKHIKLICHNVVNEHGQITNVEGIVQNITEHTELTREFHIAKQALNQSHDAIVITDRDNQITHVNSKVEELTGYSQSDLIGESPDIFSSGLQSAEFYQQMWAELENNGRWEGELWNRKKTGTIYPELLSISTLLDEHQDVSHYIGVFKDLSQRKNNEKQIERFQKYEFVTGLTKRQFFIQEVEDRIQRELQVSVALFDIKGFSHINQNYGDEYGDKLLSAVASRLEMILSDECLACRYGSDEFAISIQGGSDTAVLELCDSIKQDLLTGYQVGGHTINVDWAVGVSSMSELTQKTNPMMQAKLALDKSKEAQGRPVLFTSTLENQALRKIKLKKELEAAIEANSLEVHYQPIYNTDEESISKFEALARWKTDAGYISPFEFIAIAEEYNLIAGLGRCVLEIACRDLRRLYDQGYTDVVFSVNRSIKELNTKELHHSSVNELLNKYDLPTTAIVIEITESISLDDNPVAKQVLDQLKQSGIKLAIDDFGTGYASFVNLIDQDLDYLKVDRSFIKNLSTDKNSMILTKTAINLANQLDLDVIAEGVETRCQLNLLKSLGCQFVQGYYLGKPAPFDEIYTHLSKKMESA